MPAAQANELDSQIKQASEPVPVTIATDTELQGFRDKLKKPV